MRVLSLLQLRNNKCGPNYSFENLKNMIVWNVHVLVSQYKEKTKQIRKMLISILRVLIRK